MAATALSDFQIDNEVFMEQIMLEMLEKDVFFRSGAAVQNATANQFLAAGVGENVALPFQNQLVDEEANVSTDDSTSTSTPANLSGNKQLAIRQPLNKSWTSMDILQNYMGKDPLAEAQRFIANWWIQNRERRVIESLGGVIADNVANDSGDMVVDVTAETGDAALIDSDVIIDGKATMGDRRNQLGIMLVHPVVMTRLQKLQLIDTVHDSEQMVTFDTYQGSIVLEANRMPVDTSGPDDIYTTYLLGAGSLIFGQGPAKESFEIDRTPEAGNGGGQETIYSRLQMLIHPLGFQFTSASMALNAPTEAELAAAANWDRVFERTRVNVAALKTLG